MEKKFKDLYEAIRCAYEDMSIRENAELSRVLLAASNELIGSKDVQMTAVSLDRKLNQYTLVQDSDLPHPLEPLKRLTRKFACDYCNKGPSSS